MARRGKAEHHTVAPDSKYSNLQIANFINRVMTRGKKTVASRAVYGAFDIIGDKTKKNPVEVFETALRNAGPNVEVRPRRVGGATLQVPVEVPSDRRVALAMRWLIANSRARSGKTYAEKLAGELMDAAANQGATIKKKEETHKMAEANRAFAHYRW
ncbi:MAG: 30S ribosomal protein S7 [Anaerolineales bacterium]|nr:30S ribosomal protein S7 [Anaerolineales bacterium]